MTAFEERRGREKVFLIITTIAICAAAVICYGMVSDLLVVSATVALLPLLILIIVSAFDRRLIAYLLLFVVNFFVPLAERFSDNFPAGMFMDILICFNFLVIICNMLTRKARLSNISGDLVLVILVWLIFCFLEILNPKMITIQSWMSSFRSMALYFFLITILVQTSVNKFRDVKVILVVWSILVLVSAFKAMLQKVVGFSASDMHFLYDMGGLTTHIIYYGIRYFSIFSDASNFGGSMAMALVVFSIVGLHTKSLPMKLYYWFVAAAGCYGMFISGTRSALVVPIAGILLYLVLIRNWKLMVPVGLALGLAVGLLAFTTVGESVTEIRRARTAFHRDEDLSYQIRKENQKTLKEIMAKMPMGNSLGMSGGRAKNYGDTSPIADIPTDSWFVQIWVETGVIGMLIYFAMMFYIFAKACWTIFFKIRDKEVHGVSAALISGVAGLFVMSSNSEVFSQYPNGILVYTSIGLVFMAPIFDREMTGKQEKKNERLPENIADNGQLQRA